MKHRRLFEVTEKQVLIRLFEKRRQTENGVETKNSVEMKTAEKEKRRQIEGENNGEKYLRRPGNRGV